MAKGLNIYPQHRACARFRPEDLQGESCASITHVSAIAPTGSASLRHSCPEESLPEHSCRGERVFAASEKVFRPNKEGTEAVAVELARRKLSSQLLNDEYV